MNLNVRGAFFTHNYKRILVLTSRANYIPRTTAGVDDYFTSRSAMKSAGHCLRHTRRG